MGLFKKKPEYAKANVELAPKDYYESPMPKLEAPISSGIVEEEPGQPYEAVDDEIATLKRKIQEKEALIKQRKEEVRQKEQTSIDFTPQEMLDMIEANQARTLQMITYFRRRFNL